MLSIGQQIGVGKESDIYLVHGTRHHEVFHQEQRQDSNSSSDEDEGDEEEAFEAAVDSPPELHERVLKIQRLGRTSFRTVKANRDYHQHRKSCSWLYLSRLAAGLEFRFMRALREAGLPVPKPLDWNRHCVVMEWIRGTLLDNVRLEQPVNDADADAEAEAEIDEELRQVEEELSKFEIENRVVEWIKEAEVPKLYARLMELIGELGRLGLIHGDFNEFNLMLTRDSANRPTPVIIDFPQMVSVDHKDGQFYFERDVECIRVFFEKRFGFVNEDGAIPEPHWEEIIEYRKSSSGDDNSREETLTIRKLDVELRASGYIKPRRKNKRQEQTEESATDYSEDDLSEGSDDYESHEEDEEDSSADA